MSFPERSISIENVRGVVISGAPTMNFPLGPRVISSTGTDSPVTERMFLIDHVYLKRYRQLFSWNVDPLVKLKGILLRSRDKPHQNE